MVNLEKLCELIQNYYIYNSVGGNLHIVLDDGNLEDHHIEYCLKTLVSEKKDEEAKVIGESLLNIPYDTRKKLYSNSWEYKDPASIKFIRNEL